MRSEEIENHISRLLDNSQLSNRELAELQERFEFNPQFAEEATDQQVLDALLHFEALSPQDHETFVQNCLSKMTPQPVTPPALLTQHPFGIETNRAIVDCPDLSETKIQITTPSQGKPAHSIWPTHRTLAACAALAATLLLFFFALNKDLFVNSPKSSENPSLASSLPALVVGEKNSTPPVLIPADPVFPESKQAQSLSDNKPSKSKRTNHQTPQAVVSNPMPDSLPTKAIPARPVEKINLGIGQDESTFARLLTPATLSQSDATNEKRLGSGPLNIPSGNGEIKFDSGVNLFFEGPFSASAVSENSITVEEGTLYLETTQPDTSFHLTSSERQWSTNGESEFQFRVDHSGIQECYVLRGQVHLSKTGTSEPEPQITIKPKGLNQILIEPSDANELPSIMAARGQNQFLGQVGLPNPQENQTPILWQTDSPTHFATTVNQLLTFGNQKPNNQIYDRWKRFVEQSQQMNFQKTGTKRQFEKLLNEFLGSQANGKSIKIISDDSLLDSTLQQGSIKLDDIEKKLESLGQFRGTSGLPHQPQDQNTEAPRPNQPTQSFQAELNLNGRVFKFTSPTQLDAFRRRAKR